MHYINDYDRGKIWEGSIVMMPQNVTMVMLSATIPRAQTFVEWIRDVKAPKPVGLVTTDYRPVPLQHYLFWDDAVHLIYDEHGRHTETYDTIRRAVLERHKTHQPQKRGGDAKGAAQQPVPNKFPQQMPPNKPSNKPVSYTHLTLPTTPYV